MEEVQMRGRRESEGQRPREEGILDGKNDEVKR